jgi:ketosteroid isomerase-like protein
MSKSNKDVLEEGNAHIVAGNNEGFLALCTEDIVWTTVGESTLKGKQAVREWMQEAYVEPPEFTAKHMVAEGDYVVALGDITSKDKHGKPTQNAYSDVWRFHGGKMAELKAFVVQTSR